MFDLIPRLVWNSLFLGKTKYIKYPDWEMYILAWRNGIQECIVSMLHTARLQHTVRTVSIVIISVILSLISVYTPLLIIVVFKINRHRKWILILLKTSKSQWIYTVNISVGLFPSEAILFLSCFVIHHWYSLFRLFY